MLYPSRGVTYREPTLTLQIRSPMSTILESVLTQLQDRDLDLVSRSIGADRNQVETVIGAALPVMLGALGRNAQSPQGAASLASALDRNHDGSVLDDLQGFLSGNPSAQGDAIVGHMLDGKQRQEVESGISRLAGLDTAKIAKLLPILAPIVMGALGKLKRSQKAGAGDLGDLLGREERELQLKAPRSKSLIGGLLDQDGDGDFDLSDVAKGVFKTFF